MRRNDLRKLRLFCAPLLLLAACSASDDSPGGRGGTKANGAGGAVNAGGTTDNGAGGAGGNAAGGNGSGATGGNATGGGSTGGSINTGGTPPDGSAADGSFVDAPACSAVVAENEVSVVTTYTPIDLYFMVDRSGSMITADVLGNPTRWAALSSALGAFVDSSAMDGGAAGLGMGMAFFPITGNTNDGGRGGGGNNNVSSCNVADYARAVVDIAELPANAPPIKNAVAATMPNGGTPTQPALRGAVQYATAYQQAHMDRKVAIVLATDGEPNDCQSSAANVATVAAAAYAQTPPLATYVLGIGPSTGNLDTIAAAGGTQAAYMVTASGTGALLQALNAIRTKTQTQSGTKVACTQKIPPATGTQALDYASAIITTIVGTNSNHPPKVGDAAACGSSDGWYFDNATAPTSVTFCPVTCAALSPEAGKSRVTIEIPCLPPPTMPPH